MEKDFFDVFPSLKVKKELEELLDMVFVTRVSCNPSRTHIWVYIKSERWIHKKHIFELEDAREYGYLIQLVQTKGEYIFHHDRIAFNTIQTKVFHLLEEIYYNHF